MTPLRASAYTAHHVASAGRHRLAVITAAAAWWNTRTDIADCETSIAHAQEADDAATLAVLEHAKLNAQTRAEHLYRDVYELVCRYETPEVWTGTGAGGSVRVTWNPALQMLSIDVSK